MQVTFSYVSRKFNFTLEFTSSFHYTVHALNLVLQVLSVPHCFLRIIMLFCNLIYRSFEVNIVAG